MDKRNQIVKCKGPAGNIVHLPRSTAESRASRANGIRILEDEMADVPDPQFACKTWTPSRKQEPTKLNMPIDPKEGLTYLGFDPEAFEDVEAFKAAADKHLRAARTGAYRQGDRRKGVRQDQRHTAQQPERRC